MWVAKYDERLEEWLDTIPADIKAKVLRIVDMLVMFGPHNVREPYVKHVEGQRKLFEIRAKGKDGIARVFYCTIDEQRIILLHGFTKKTDKTPKKEIAIAVKRMQEVIHG
jgi:phage-related protein